MVAVKTAPEIGVSVRCAIAAFAVVRGDARAIATWRKQPLHLGPVAMPVSFLKHADNQTVIAIEAIRRALPGFENAKPDFHQWGVIGGSGFFGREKCARAIIAYPTDGAWGVQPHLIPHQSVHAISGTISQALQSHGPNLGTGSGPNGLPDALLLAASFAMDRTLPGIWLVLTGHEAEYVPCAIPSDEVVPDCLGVALALVPADGPTGGAELRLRDLSSEGLVDWHAELNIDSLSHAVERRHTTTWRLGGMVTAEIDFNCDWEA